MGGVDTISSSRIPVTRLQLHVQKLPAKHAKIREKKTERTISYFVPFRFSHAIQLDN
jgi:hypothetical protein